MFTFDDWNLSYDGQVLAMQHDNKSRQIIVQGTFPVGYTWAMEVQVGTAWDAIVLSPVSGGLAALLTQDNLAYAGWYEMQLRGAQGDVVRRTNIIRVHVPRSLSGTGQWPTVPSEFIQIEQRIADLNAHPSKPGVNGNWMVWDPDAQEYRESDIPLPDVSVGPAGPAATVEVAETITGAPGSDASVENLGTENAALLRFTIPSGPAGPAGTTPQISVTVTTLPAGQDVTVQVSGPAEAPTIALGIPQGEPGERGPQGLQGFQGWGLSAAALDSDGALVLTIRNPADGQTQTLPPVPIDNSAALQAVATSIAAQGTTQVQRVEEAGDDAVGAVSTAKDAALEAVGQAQTTATGAVASAQTTAVQAVQDAQGTATTAISQAQTAAVGAVEGAKTGALESVGALVQQAEDAAIRQPIISEHDTWMIWDAASGQYVDTGLYAGGQAPYIGDDGYWYVGNVKTDTLARGPKGDPGEGVPSTDGVPTDYLLSPAGWVAPPDTNGNLWGYHERVELEVQTGAVIFTPDKPLKKILLLIYAKQEYADEAGQDEPSGDTAQHIQINNSGKNIFYNLFSAGSFAKFKKSRVLLEIVESNLVGTYEKLVGTNSGGYDCCGADYPLADDFPIYDNINSVSIHPIYKYASSYGNIGRFTAGSTFEIWGVYL